MIVRKDLYIIDRKKLMMKEFKYHDFIPDVDKYKIIKENKKISKRRYDEYDEYDE